MIRSTNFYRGFVLGAGLMYFLDPDQGRARRAALREKVTGAANGVRDFLNGASHRLERDDAGVLPQPSARDRSLAVDDEAIAARVRSRLGRYVSHPRAVTVEARDGSVTLRGPILRAEVEALISAVSSVRGVNEVLNRMEPHDAGDGTTELRGPGRDPAAGPRRSASVSPAIQVVAGVLSATAVAYGAGRIAARIRTARRQELEREMPEYAMLR